MDCLTTLQHKLLDWFAAHGRDLPWRATRDPYRILVSEVMLQQTQVDRVIPKYYAFLAAFPTLEALAEAPTAEVIRLWAGLGYNRRAVNLQRAARAVLEQHDGVFPRQLDAIRALPGVGPYTAGAVACFAFEQDVAFIDTNIRRVVRRLWVGPDGGEAAQAASEAALLDLARVAVPQGQGWHWNQAIMELGALICRADAPACWRCPLRDECRAYGELRQADEQIFVVGAVPKPKQRRVAERREAPYAGSNRFYRGRLIDALRGLPDGAPLADLGPQVRPEGFSAANLPWLVKLAEGLARDGLLVLHEDEGVLRVRLPE
jgi:A/G-specific adenine glycosylase